METIDKLKFESWWGWVRGRASFCLGVIQHQYWADCLQWQCWKSCLTCRKTSSWQLCTPTMTPTYQFCSPLLQWIRLPIIISQWMVDLGQRRGSPAVYSCACTNMNNHGMSMLFWSTNVHCILTYHLQTSGWRKKCSPHFHNLRLHSSYMPSTFVRNRLFNKESVFKMKMPQCISCNNCQMRKNKDLQGERKRH